MNISSRIAFITVLFNSEKHLPLFFECMGKQTDRDFLLIVIDNDSKDASFTLAKKLAAEYDVSCEFIANESNLGIAAGNNQGIEFSLLLGLEHHVLINNDISSDSNLVANIRKKAIDRGFAAWTCLAYYGDTQEHWYGGGRLSYWLARGIHFSQNTSEQIGQQVAVSYAPTCLMYLHSSVFEQIGLMDPRYFVYYDDTDYCRRLCESRITLMYDPTVSYRHYVGGSSGGDMSPFSIRINTRNKFLYIQKHYGSKMRWIVGLVALSSKLLQLANSRRRAFIWLGLREAFILLRKTE